MVLQTNTIKAATGSRRSRKMRGRGNASGHGNYSGHGGKGQTARSGGSKGLALKGFRRLMQMTPKSRGFNSLKIKPAEVRLRDLEKKYNAGETVNLKTLKEKSIIGKNILSAKIYNTGELSKKLVIEGIAVTAKAKEMIEKAGGTLK
jgi:large subunit ribosomal protein L15